MPGLAPTRRRASRRAPDVEALYDEIFRDYSRGVASHEKVRAVRLVSEPFSVDNGLLTPTLKPKRKAIEAHHAALVEAMYEGT